MNLESLFAATHACREHPTFHPEGTLNKHILLVAIRAMLISANKDLVLAAFLHDLHKPSAGASKSLPNGTFWSNPDHAIMAAECDVIRHAVWSMGGNVDVVIPIIRRHMEVKEHITRKSRSVAFIDQFRIFDDMIERHVLPSNTGTFFIPDIGNVNGTINFVGQSTIQRHFQNGQFTVTLNRTPLTFPIERIPEFFVGQWAELRFLASLCV
jgi:hypothetical protein